MLPPPNGAPVGLWDSMREVQVWDFGAAGSIELWYLGLLQVWIWGCTVYVQGARLVFQACLDKPGSAVVLPYLASV